MRTGTERSGNGASARVPGWVCAPETMELRQGEVRAWPAPLTRDVSAGTEVK